MKFPLVGTTTPSVVPLLPPLLYHYDFSDASSITLVGSKISVVNDLGPGGFNLSNTNDAQRLTYVIAGQNGLNIAQGFGGQFIRTSVGPTNTPPVTYFLVLRDTGPVGTLTYFLDGGSLNRTSFLSGPGSNAYMRCRNDASGYSNNSTAPGTFDQVTLFHDDTTAFTDRLRVNGTLVAGALGAASSTGVILAAAGNTAAPIIGELCEIRAYNGVVSAAGLTFLENLLSTKWDT